jgi:hypothetical protein
VIKQFHILFLLFVAFQSCETGCGNGVAEEDADTSEEESIEECNFLEGVTGVEIFETSEVEGCGMDYPTEYFVINNETEWLEFINNRFMQCTPDGWAFLRSVDFDFDVSYVYVSNNYLPDGLGWLKVEDSELYVTMGSAVLDYTLRDDARGCELRPAMDALTIIVAEVPREIAQVTECLHWVGGCE